MTRTEPKQPERWDRQWPAGWTVEHVAATGSTNADLLERPDARPDRAVLVADYQDAGRGRLDRTWASPPGANLLVSLLFHDVPHDPTDLPRRVSLAAVDACRRFTTGELGLKWPNDVLLDGRKLAGVLAHRGPTGPVVVGIGINVGWCLDTAARLGAGVDRADLLAALLTAYDTLSAAGRELYERYRSELATLGMRVRVELADGEVIGTATDLMLDGRLVVVDGGGTTHRFEAGDVVHLRPTQ